MLRILRSFKDAANGFVSVLREEDNFKIELTLGVLVLFAAFICHFNHVEWALVIFAIGLVVSAEIVNTVVEDLCNKIEPGQDPIIGKIKDMMAAYVLVCAIAALVIAAFLFLSRF